jgi:hypothetical protein
MAFCVVLHSFAKRINRLKISDLIRPGLCMAFHCFAHFSRPTVENDREK